MRGRTPDVSETRTGLPSQPIPGIEDLQPVGRGGFGTVYQGWQPDLRRKVAVKVLDVLATDVEGAARFRRETMAMGALSDHPNVVPVYATGTVGDRLYLVMPLFADGSLADQLEAGPLAAAEVVQLGLGLADALAAAHGAGVLHRDVKPANVLRTAYGAPQLADFGVARFVDTTQTMGGGTMATVAYAAPEILSGEASSEASDVYSLGATLHAALRGRAPYEAGPDEAPISMAVRVLSTDPPDLRDDGVPAELAALVERAMARNVSERFPTAAALRDALAAVDLDRLDPAGPGPATAPMAAIPPVAPTVAAPLPDERPPAPAEARRSPWLWLLLAVLVGLAVGFFLLSRQGADGGDTDTAAPSTTAPSTTAEPTTTAAPVTSATPETTAATAPAAPATSATDALRDYYALMDDGRIDEGFTRLSPAYQQRTGEASYRSFWETIDRVEVLEAESEDLTATATLRYTSDDGTTSTEEVSVRFVEDASTGALLIDDYRVG